MFGSTNTAQPASGGFSFGSSPAAPAAGGGGGGGFTFGNAAATPAATPASGSSGFSFGAAPATATASAAPSAFSFGGVAATSAAPTTTSSFSFGGASGATSKPPLFGQTGASPTGGFGFGTGTGTGTTTAGAPTGSSFGGFGAAVKPASGFGFGTGAGTPTTPTTGFGGFGTSAASTPAQPTGFGGFGFGTTATASAAPPAFGTAPAAVTTPAPIIVGADAAVAQLNTIKYAYEDPMQSRFKFLMYNTVDPSQRHLYVRPPHISERMWEQAEQDNPDPLNCVPVSVVGFKDLLKRIQVQQDYAGKYNGFADDLRRQLKEMEKASRTTEEKLEKCRHEHVQLAHMLVKVMKDIEFLQNLGKPLQREEINLAMALKKLQKLLDAPGQYKARLKDATALQRLQTEGRGSNTTNVAGNQLSPADMKRIYEFLDQQRQGLEHLTTLLNDDLADIKLMKETWRR